MSQTITENGQIDPEVAADGDVPVAAPESPDVGASPAPKSAGGAISRWARPIFRRPAQGAMGWLTSNLYLKVLSFALALVLWARVSEDQIVGESTEVFLDVRRPDGLVLLNPPAPTVNIQVSAPRSKIKALRKSHLELVVDLSNAQVGEMDYSLVGQRIRNLPSGVDVTAYSPSSFKLEFDELMTRVLPIRPKIEGKPASGFKVVEDMTLVEPRSVTVEGPKRDLKNMREISTEPIRLTDLRNTHEARYPLALESPYLHLKDASEEVRVRVVIEPEIEERHFADVEVVVPETVGNYSLLPERADVYLEGPSEILRKVDPAEVRILLQEGSIPMSELQTTRVLRYPSSQDGKGLPRILVTWPRDDVLKLKRINPTRFKFRLVESN